MFPPRKSTQKILSSYEEILHDLIVDEAEEVLWREFCCIFRSVGVCGSLFCARVDLSAHTRESPRAGICVSFLRMPSCPVCKKCTNGDSDFGGHSYSDGDNNGKGRGTVQ